MQSQRSATAPSGTLFLDEAGLGDALASWSITRKMRSAYSGSAIRVRRSSDNTEQDIGFVSNELDTSSLTSFVGANNGFVVTVYDQASTNNMTQSTASLQPQIVASGVVITGANGKPALRCDGSDDKIAALFTINQPSTGFYIFAQKGWTSGDGIAGGGGGITQSLIQTTASPQFAMFAGSAAANSTGFNIDAWNLGTFIYNGASSSWRRNDGSATTVNPNTGNSSGFTWGARSSSDASCAQVDWQETTIYGSAKSTGNQTTARNNINDFYALW